MATSTARLLLPLALTLPVEAWSPGCGGGVLKHSPKASAQRAPAAVCGLFDGLFGDSPEQKAAKDAEWQAQQEMVRRRRDPEAMAAYEAEVQARRAAASAKDAELVALQKAGGAEALDEWKRLKAEGKIQASDAPREAGERSWGGEGLVADRIDEQLPYLESGYVDESQPDVMTEMGNAFGKFFGGGNKGERE
jgi:hypothetical protein